MRGEGLRREDAIGHLHPIKLPKAERRFTFTTYPVAMPCDGVRMSHGIWHVFVFRQICDMMLLRCISTARHTHDH